MNQSRLLCGYFPVAFHVIVAAFSMFEAILNIITGLMN